MGPLVEVVEPAARHEIGAPDDVAVLDEPDALAPLAEHDPAARARVARQQLGGQVALGGLSTRTGADRLRVGSLGP